MNYQIELDKIIEENKKKNKTPTLLLHVCCAPCSSYVLEYLSKSFKITCFYYNPNITEEAEYKKRIAEEQRLLKEMPFENEVNLIEEEYETSAFEKIAKGRKDQEELGTRCYDCYKLRLTKTASFAKENNFDYFGTTLSVSPHKNSKWLNEIGKSLATEYQISFLYADFKKKDGYKRSIVLSNQYRLYRQDYCGCIYSKKAKDKKRKLSYEG